MNFLNVGPSELMVILLIAILLIGPKRMAQAVQAIGKLSRQMRKLSGEFVGAIRSEIQTTEEDIKHVVDEAKGSADGTEGITGELAETKKVTDQSLKDIVEGDLGLSSITEDIRAVQREAQGMMQDIFSEVMTAADVDSRPSSRKDARSGQVPSEQTASHQPAIADPASAPDMKPTSVMDSSDGSADQDAPETVETPDKAPISTPPPPEKASTADTDAVAVTIEMEVSAENITVDGFSEPTELDDNNVETAVPASPEAVEQSSQDESPRDEKADTPTDLVDDGTEEVVPERAGSPAAETDVSEHTEPGNDTEKLANGETETTEMATETRPEVSKS